MRRHSTEHIRYQRERYIKRRVRARLHWLYNVDWWAITRGLPPRPYEERYDDFFDAKRKGKYAKWNGTCSCWMCRHKSTMYNRAAVKCETATIQGDYDVDQIKSEIDYAFKR